MEKCEVAMTCDRVLWQSPVTCLPLCTQNNNLVTAKNAQIKYTAKDNDAQLNLKNDTLTALYTCQSLTIVKI